MVPELLPTPAVSAAYLRSKLIASLAESALHSALHYNHMSEVFLAFFPKEYKRHKKRKIMQPEARHDMLADFYRLVRRDLFCYDDPSEWWDEGVHALAPYVEMHIHNRDWWQWDYKNLNPFEQVVLTGAGFVVAGELNLDEGMEVLQDIDRTKLAELCGTKRPLCYLVEAVDVVAHTTGNCWMDVECEMLDSGYVELPTWTEIAEIRFLADEHKAALQIERRLKALDRWLREDELRRGLRLVAQVETALNANGDLDALIADTDLEAIRKLRQRPSRFERAADLIRRCLCEPVKQQVQVRV